MERYGCVLGTAFIESLADRFHRKYYTPKIHQIEKLRFLSTNFEFEFVPRDAEELTSSEAHTHVLKECFEEMGQTIWADLAVQKLGE